LPALGKDLNSATAACGEIEIRGISSGQVGVGDYAAPANSM
jgi:hypothetical protein